MGKTLNEAIKIASFHDLSIKISKEKDDADLPDGTIISQIPAADTLIKARQSIYLIVSKKPAIMPMPNFMQKNLAEIKQEAEAKEITLKIYELSSENTANNCCIAHYPAPNMKVRDKNAIIYSANDSLKPVIMPALKGKSVNEVLEFLQLHGLQAQLIHANLIEQGHSCSHCIVFDQRPLAGSIISWTKEKPLQVQLHVG